MTPWKEEKIRKRDGNACMRCESMKNLKIMPLIPPIIGIKNAIFPSVVHGLFCKKCRKLLRRWGKGRIVRYPDEEFEKYCQIYHGGIFQAEQYLKSIARK